MDKVQENIVEISMYVGYMIHSGTIPKDELDLPSSDMAEQIITWAAEFEAKYGQLNYEEIQQVPELGGVFGYLDAIDKFAELKCKEAGWMKDSYIL